MRMISYGSFIIGLIGVLIIVWGAIVTIIRLGSIEWESFRGKKDYIERNRIRHHFSVYLLTGLEYMIGADIIRTVTSPTLQELMILGSMVAIRTVISFFLNKEMKNYRD